jgi:hypothetical protein
MDGTFDACPAIFAQLFTLHAFVDGKLLPLVYCLLANKSAAIYTNVFQVLKNAAAAAGYHLQPTTIMSDFETGLIAAVATEFPNTHHQGCYFHFTQAIWRHMQSLGLTALYIGNDAVKAHIRRLMALGFAPLLLVRTAFTQLEVQSPNAALQPLFAYFRQQWLTTVPPKYWNVQNIDIRTNNDCEGWHHRFNMLVNKHHPNIWLYLCPQ